MSLREGLLSTALILCGLSAGCATEGPPPSEPITRARTVIEEADKGAAQRYAAADLQRAHDELNDAEKENAAGHYDEARRYAESASVDADLAAAKGADGDAEHAAREVVQANETLSQESTRISVTPNQSPQ
jgi:Domain of unknown function (DUF4398)